MFYNKQNQYTKSTMSPAFSSLSFKTTRNLNPRVFSDLSKYSTSQGDRVFQSDEFIQMAGRAGRRNIDTKGYIIFLPQLFKVETYLERISSCSAVKLLG